MEQAIKEQHLIQLGDNNGPYINATGNANLTITATGGSVIIRLG